MSNRATATLALLLLIMPFGSALADKYADTIKIFKDAGQSAKYFDNAYGYAVFPTIGKAGLVGQKLVATLGIAFHAPLLLLPVLGFLWL